MTNQSNPREQGQGFVEYAIIIALVGLVVIVVVNVLRPAIADVFSRFVEQAAVSPPTLFEYTPPPPEDPNQPPPCYRLNTNVFPDGLAGTINVEPEEGNCPGDTSRYLPGTSVRLEAVADNPDFVFDRWSESAGGGRDPVAHIVMSSERLVEAYFANVTNCHTVALPTVSPPEGGSASLQPGPNCGSQYADGTLVEFRAAPAGGYSFVAWGGDISGSSARQTIVVESDLTNVIANFDELPCFTVTVNYDEDMGSFTRNREPNCGNNQYAQGTSLTLQAQPNVGYTFDGWSGDHSSGNTSITFTVDDNKTVAANFSQCYTINWVENPSTTAGYVVEDSTPTCGNGYYLPNSTARLFAQPNLQFSFVNWSGDHTGSSQLANIVMNSDKNVVANFAQCFPVTATASPTNGGTATVSPAPDCGGGNYHSQGRQVTFTAVPQEGYQFTGWTGSVTSSDPTIILLVQSAINLTANFEPVANCDNPSLPLITQINFQRPVDTAPAGYLADGGHAFGNRGNGFSYGWNADNTGNARLRSNNTSPTFMHDTLNHMQMGGTFSWEIALPNNVYQVCVVAGDPSNFDSNYRINVEGTLVVNHQPTTNSRWGEGMAMVAVSDGRLSITNAGGSSNNKINFVRIYGDPPVLLSQGRPAQASSTRNNYPASNANDGNFTTEWQSGTNNPNEWWEVDLGASYNLSRLEITFRENNYGYVVQVSQDGSSFNTIINRTGANDSGLRVFDLAHNARFVRIANINSSGNRTVIAEVQVIGN
jgi:uncharacterized repeat protein (TIGR02543 family)